MSSSESSSSFSSDNSYHCYKKRRKKKLTSRQKLKNLRGNFHSLVDELFDILEEIANK